MTTPYNPFQTQTFAQQQTAGQARPPQTQYQQPSLPTSSLYQPYGGQTAYASASNPTPNMDPRGQGSPGATLPNSSGSSAPTSPVASPQFNPSAVPDLSGQWASLYNQANVNYGAPGTSQSNFQPGNYQGPGQFNAYQASSYDPGAYHSQSTQQAGPGAAAHMGGPGSQMQFSNGGLGNATDAATFQSIMQGLANPSRYGSQAAGQTYDLLNDKLTQQGNADYGRINEDMARRGIFNSSTAGGRLGDLATNLNRSRSDYATQVALDQAKNYAGDRSNAISQALGYGGQQFGQSLGGFNANLASQGQNYGQGLNAFQANLASQGQNFNQGLQANQFNENRGQTAYQNNLGRNTFLLGQNNQNYNQQANQYGQNQQEAQNRYQSGLNNAQFGLNQNQQNYNQNANQFNQQQQAQQQTFQQLLAAITGQQGNQQQGFENQVTTQQVNNQQQQAYMQYLAQLMGAAQ